MNPKTSNYPSLIYIIVFFCLLFYINEKKAFAQKNIFKQETIKSLTVEKVTFEDAVKSKGISGFSLRLHLTEKVEGSLLGLNHALLVAFNKADGKPLKSLNRFSIYSNKQGEVVYAKGFKINKGPQIISFNSNSATTVTDLETDKEIKTKGDDKHFPLTVFIPYYVLDFPSGKQELTAQFYFAEKFYKLLDTTKTVLYKRPAGQQTYRFEVDKPIAQTVKMGVDELQATEKDGDGKDWDWDITSISKKAPDMYWRVELVTDYKKEVIYTSKSSEDTYFNKWLYEYTPVFTISKGDYITITVLDKDWMKEPDIMGTWSAPMDKIVERATKGTEISFANVKRMILNPPNMVLEAVISHVKVDTSQKDWDIDVGVFEGAFAPDLQCKVTEGDGNVLYQSEVADNTYELKLFNARFMVDVGSKETLTIEVIDKDWVQDDVMVSFSLPLNELVQQKKPRILQKNGVELTLEVQ